MAKYKPVSQAKYKKALRGAVKGLMRGILWDLPSAIDQVIMDSFLTADEKEISVDPWANGEKVHAIEDKVDSIETVSHNTIAADLARVFLKGRRSTFLENWE